MRSLLLLALVASIVICDGLNAQTWSMTPTASDPPLRRENPGASDGTFMYVFGGQSGTSGGVVRNDLWAFDGTNWVEMNPDGAAGAPPARAQAGITWDWGRNKLVVFGGKDAANLDLADVWEWDPTTNTWTDATPVSGSPSARRFTALAYDWANAQVVMFGGLENPTNTHLNDTWHWNGTFWTQLAPVGPIPQVRRQHMLVDRADFADVIMFGGQEAGGAGMLGDTWQWNGINWSQIATTVSPAGKVAIDAAYDLQRQRIVVASGNPGPTGSNSEFDSLTNDWIILPLDPGIYKCTRYFMGYLSTTGKVYKVSGQALNPAAPADKTYENGLGLPSPYPGNGADAAIDVAVNGANVAPVAGVITINSADSMGFHFHSPGGALDNEIFAFVADVVPTGMTWPGSNLPGEPLSVWFNPSGAIPILNGFAAGSGPFVPTLGSSGFDFGPFPVPPTLSGTGTSVVIQLVVNAPGLNAFNTGFSDAIELQLL